MRARSAVVRRLGVIGSLGLIAGVAPLAALPASATAATSVYTPGLNISPTGAGATSNSTTTFTTQTAIANAGTITIVSQSATTPNKAAADVALPSASPSAVNPSNYTVSYASGGTTTSVTVGNTTVGADSNGNPEVTLTLASSIPANAAVSVAITGTTNPSLTSGAAPDDVYFTDSTSTDTAPANTNQVVIATASTSGAPTITDLNPQALPSDQSQPFTLVGTFNTGFASPYVCFVASGTAAPAPPSSGAPTCSGTDAAPATVTYASATELEAMSPSALAAGTYNVVVYNDTTSSNAYSSASAANAVNEISTVAGLDVIPESGVRVADSRVPLGLPLGPIASGKTASMPLADLFQHPSLASNIPNSATAITVNVTVVAPSTVGNLEVYGAASSCGTPPGIATVNFQPGVDTNNNVIVPISGDSVLCVNDNGASVNVVIDADGYAVSNASSSTPFTATNKRILDTRPATQVGSLHGPLPGRTVFSVATGQAPGTKIAINVAAVDPSAVGNLRVFPEPPVTGSSGCTTPSASQVPNTAVVNYIAHVDASSYYITEAGCGGNIDIYSDTAGTVNVVIDMYGTIGSAHVFVLSTPYRALNQTELAAGQHATVSVITGGGTTAGTYTPATAVGTIGTVSAIAPSGVGNIRTYPDGTPLPDTATIADYPGQTRIDDVLVALSPTTHSIDIYADGDSVGTTYDVSAYIG